MLDSTCLQNREKLKSLASDGQMTELQRQCMLLEADEHEFVKSRLRHLIDTSLETRSRIQTRLLLYVNRTHKLCSQPTFLQPKPGTDIFSFHSASDGEVSSELLYVIS